MPPKKPTGKRPPARAKPAPAPPPPDPAYESFRLKPYLEPEEDDGLTVQQRRFLAAFRVCGNLTQAAEMAGCTRQLHYDASKDSPRYVAAFAAAQVESVERLEAEARRRAMTGSDALLIFLLKAARPEVYRDLHRYVDGRIVHDVRGQVDHRHGAAPATDEERTARLQQLIANARARAGVPALPYHPGAGGNGHADGAGGSDR
jgi:hypothetical protein